MHIKNRIYCLLNYKDPFEILQDSNISDNQVLRDNASSAYQLFFVIGTLGLLITFIVSGIKISSFLIRDRNKRSEIKSALGFKVWLAILFFSFIPLVNMLYQIIKMFV